MEAITHSFIDGLPFLKMGGSFHGKLLVITRWYLFSPNRLNGQDNPKKSSHLIFSLFWIKVVPKIPMVILLWDDFTPFRHSGQTKMLSYRMTMVAGCSATWKTAKAGPLFLVSVMSVTGSWKLGNIWKYGNFCPAICGSNQKFVYLVATNYFHFSTQ